MLRLLVRIAILSLTSMSAVSLAQTYPSRPIRIVVPYPPAGGVDTVARILQPKLQSALGQAVVVENRPGAAGIIGTDLVAKSPPDGYTLVLAVSNHTVNPSLYKKLPYDTLRDFAAISLIAFVPNILVVNSAVKADSVKELVELARGSPGTLNFGSAGVGTPFHLAGELFNLLANVRIVHVPYKGGPQAIADLLGGRVQIVFGNLFNVLPHLKSGRLKALAVTSAKRMSVMPDVPTIAESGVPNYEFGTWYGLLAPAQTPADTIQRLNVEVNGVLELAEIRKQFADQAADIRGSTPQEFAAFLQSDMEKSARVVKEAGITPE